MDHWGLGVNRVADLRLHEINEEKDDIRQIIIQDTWNRSEEPERYDFNVRFTIFDPLYKEGDEMWIEHAGNSNNFYFHN